jgi:inner membrane protein
VDPVTHTLTGLALSRTGLSKLSRLALPMFVASSLAADLDWFASLAGPRAYLRGNRTVTHSLLGTALIALAIAAVFWRLRRNHPTAPIRFRSALAVCGIGAGAHLFLDLGNAYGVKLLWPFSQRWFAWDLLDTLDIGILVILPLGLLLPILFRLITEEIGAKAKRGGTQRGAIIALAVALLWVGARWALHDRAIEMMRARLFHGQTPLAVAVFPSAASPLEWRGIVETDGAMDVLDVPLAPGSVFDPTVARMFYKPEPSAILEEARKSPLVQEFLLFARFPKATVQKTETGFRFELRDLRFDTWIPGKQTPRVIVELNQQTQIVSEQLLFGPAMVR